jgi:hypothetical protein
MASTKSFWICSLIVIDGNLAEVKKENYKLRHDMSCWSLRLCSVKATLNRWGSLITAGPPL